MVGQRTWTIATRFPDSSQLHVPPRSWPCTVPANRFNELPSVWVGQHSWLGLETRLASERWTMPKQTTEGTAWVGCGQCRSVKSFWFPDIDSGMNGQSLELRSHGPKGDKFFWTSGVTAQRVPRLMRALECICCSKSIVQICYVHNRSPFLPFINLSPFHYPAGEGPGLGDFVQTSSLQTRSASLGVRRQERGCTSWGRGWPIGIRMLPFL